MSLTGKFELSCFLGQDAICPVMFYLWTLLSCEFTYPTNAGQAVILSLTVKMPLSNPQCPPDSLNGASSFVLKIRLCMKHCLGQK